MAISFDEGRCLARRLREEAPSEALNREAADVLDWALTELHYIQTWHERQIEVVRKAIRDYRRDHGDELRDRLRDLGIKL